MEPALKVCEIPKYDEQDCMELGVSLVPQLFLSCFSLCQVSCNYIKGLLPKMRSASLLLSLTGFVTLWLRTILQSREKRDLLVLTILIGN